MLRIALVVNSFPSVSETFIYHKVLYLMRADFDVTVITSAPAKDVTFFSEEALQGVHIVPTWNAKNTLLFLAELVALFFRHPLRVRGFFKDISCSSVRSKAILFFQYIPFLKNRYDIVHFEFSGIAVSYEPLFLLLRKRSLIYVSCRGHAEQVKPVVYPSRRVSLRKVFSGVHRVHCVSEAMLEKCTLWGLDIEKAFVNRPAIDPAFFSSLNRRRINSETSLKIVTVGRLHWKKYHDYLLLILRAVRHLGYSFKCYIVGDGEEYERLVFLTHYLSLDDVVCFVGKNPLPKVKELLEQCDIYMHTSLSEGISNAVMEAMSMELPVLSTNVGGMSELIVDGDNGILVSMFDMEEAIKKLCSLMDDANLRKKLGANARQTILKKFTLDRQCKTFLADYRAQVNLFNKIH